MYPSPTTRGLNLELETLQQDGTEWKFGALSPKCIFAVPLTERVKYLPKGETQFGAEDFMDCVTRGYLNGAETKFTFADQRGLMKPENRIWGRQKGYATEAGVWTFSDRFTAIKSNTTRSGNSMKAPADAIYRYGLIPKKLLPKVDEMTFDEYHDKTQITTEMEDLGLAFKARFPLNYEQVYLSDIQKTLTMDGTNLAGNAWPKPVDGVYPKTDGIINHAFWGFDPAIDIFDNYEDYNSDTGMLQGGDFIKRLAKDYNFYTYGYRLYVSAENVVDDTVLTVWQILSKYGLTSFFADWYIRFQKTLKGVLKL